MDPYTKDNKNKKTVSAGSLDEFAPKYNAEPHEPAFLDTLDALVFANDSCVAIPLPKQEAGSHPSSPRTFVENTAFYHGALDEHILTFAIDQNATIQNISSSLCRLLDYQKDELLNHSWHILQPRCHHQEKFEAVWQKMDAGKKWQGEISFTARNCEQVWLSVTLVPRQTELGCIDFILAICADVTAAKNKLNVAQSFVESAIQDSHTSTGLLTVDGEVLFFNKVALERSTTLSSSILGKKIWDSPWLAGLATSQELIQQSIAACRSGEPQILQLDCFLSGGLSQASIVLRPLLDETGTVHHLVLEGRDNSLAIGVRKALQKSELKYKALADATNIGFAELDLDRRLVSANSQLLGMLGLSSARALAGMLLCEWVEEKDQAIFEEALSSCISTKQFQRIELNLQRWDKTLLPVEIFLAQLIIDGQKKLLCFVQDISARKENLRQIQRSEERLQLALSGSGAALWDWRPDDDVSFDSVYDLGWKSILGYEEEDLYSDISSWEDHLHPRDRKQALTAFMEVLLGISPVFEQEYRLKHKSGQWVWVLGRGKVMQRDAYGKPLRIAGTIVDIGDKKQVETERLSMVRKLQQAEKLEALGLLSAGIAHDFNNILVSILGYADLANSEMKHLPHSQLHHYVDQMANSGERARELVQRLMRYGRKETPNAAAFKLAPLIGKAIPIIWGAVPSSVEISCDLDEACSAVLIDPVLLHQVLSNLCVNARDAMDNKGQITIRLYELESASEDCATCMAKLNGAWVVLEVKDSGPGISEALQQQIFEPFFTTKEEENGTGIGLATVHRIAHELGGHIALESSVGQGTSFRVYFPPAG